MCCLHETQPSLKVIRLTREWRCQSLSGQQRGGAGIGLQKTRERRFCRYCRQETGARWEESMQKVVKAKIGFGVHWQPENGPGIRLRICLTSNTCKIRNNITSLHMEHHLWPIGQVLSTSIALFNFSNICGNRQNRLLVYLWENQASELQVNGYNHHLIIVFLVLHNYRFSFLEGHFVCLI